MNRLSLSQRLHLEYGGGPGDPGANPTTTIGQTGKLLSLVTWIDQAWLEIQQSQDDWLWMRAESTSNDTLALGASSVTLTGAASDYDELRPYFGHRCSFVLFYKSSIGTTDCQEAPFIPWADFHGFYDSGKYANSSGRPQFCALAPDGTLKVFPKADVAYGVKYQYRKTVQPLVADATTPLMPTKFHMLIVYLALCYYGRSNESNRIRSWLGNGLDDWSVPSSPLTTMFRDLCKEQLAPISFFGEI